MESLCPDLYREILLQTEATREGVRSVIAFGCTNKSNAKLLKDDDIWRSLYEKHHGVTNRPPLDTWRRSYMARLSVSAPTTMGLMAGQYLKGLIEDGILLIDIVRDTFSIRKGQYIIWIAHRDNELYIKYSPYINGESDTYYNLDRDRYQKDHPDDNRGDAEILRDIVDCNLVVKIPFRLTLTLL